MSIRASLFLFCSGGLNIEDFVGMPQVDYVQTCGSLKKLFSKFNGPQKIFINFAA